MLSGISRVRWVRVSAWLGRTRGFERLQEDVIERQSERDFRGRGGGPYRPMPSIGAIRQGRQPRPARASSRCAASTCMRSIISSSNRSAPPLKRRPAARARSTSACSAQTPGGRARSGSGWISDLAVEAEPPALGRFRGESLESSAVEDAVEHRNRRRPRSKHDRLKRHLKRRARRPAEGENRRAGHWCRQSAPQLHGRSPAQQARPRPSRSSPARGLPVGCATSANKMRGCRPRHDPNRPWTRDGIQVERVPFGPGAVDPDRHRHRPV